MNAVNHQKLIVHVYVDINECDLFFFVLCGSYLMTCPGPFWQGKKKSDFFYYLILWGFARFNVCFWFFYLVFALPGSFCTSFWLTCYSVSPKFDELDYWCDLHLHPSASVSWQTFSMNTSPNLDILSSNKIMSEQQSYVADVLNNSKLLSCHQCSLLSCCLLPYCMDHEQSAVWKNDSTQLSCSSQLPPT